MAVKYAFVLLLALTVGCSQKEADTVQARVPEQRAGAPRHVGMDAATQERAGITIEVARVQSIPQVVRATGRITTNGNRTWRVGAITEGRIIRVYANPGDRVERGQVLARMHSHGIQESRALYRKALADAVMLRAAESLAARTRDRYKRLYELKAASLEQLEKSEGELRSAQTAVANAEIEVNRTRLHLVEFLGVSLDTSHDHQAGDEHDEDLIPIRSPAGGTVLAASVTSGTVVGTGGEAFIISDLTKLWTIASVNEENLSRLRTGALAHVSVQAYPDRPFPGVVTKIDEELDPATRTISVRIELSNSSGRLKPEMYANVEIDAGGSDPMLFVPQSALQEVSGEVVVFVRTAPEKFEVRPVVAGRTLETRLQIVRGLEPGDEVVSRGSFLLKSQLLKSSLEE
ncbi:MAG: efflux RND transporter periplasmic adaptor subunit [Bryobacteraceae bacterium]|nr:efflux RND transporter periplasmic adaptor subunit [Bryobacterales bacterium]MEB2362337.1 efflux RND transporter periplasmic adaptor subunit [Bryobacterales bacterium]NUN01430.1 efflux RND transporter periplasmic adaptor subunit [Bryobacteraceae bacterium]